MGRWDWGNVRVGDEGSVGRTKDDGPERTR